MLTDIYVVLSCTELRFKRTVRPPCNVSQPFGLAYVLSSVSLVAIPAAAIPEGLSRLWMRACRLSWSGRENLLRHPGCLHLNGFSPVSEEKNESE